MATKQYVVRRPMLYAGVDYDQGQLITLINAQNDERLVRLGYVVEAPEGLKPVTCRKCPGKFVDEGARDRHGRSRHDPKPVLSAKQEDEAAEREEQRLNREAPLNLDKAAGMRA